MKSGTPTPRIGLARGSGHAGTADIAVGGRLGQMLTKRLRLEVRGTLQRHAVSLLSRLRKVCRKLALQSYPVGESVDQKRVTVQGLRHFKCLNARVTCLFAKLNIETHMRLNATSEVRDGNGKYRTSVRSGQAYRSSSAPTGRADARVQSDSETRYGTEDLGRAVA